MELLAVMFRQWQEGESGEGAAGRLLAQEELLAKKHEIGEKIRVERLNSVGAAALMARQDAAVHQLAALRDSLYVAEERKLYHVTYVNEEISGLHSWGSLANPPQRQLFDRKFGGNMDFLVTDVGTGDRGTGIMTDGAESRDYKPTEISLLCDPNGIHLRLDAYDERAAEVEARLLGAGSYEGYIAAGANQPYTCILS